MLCSCWPTYTNTLNVIYCYTEFRLKAPNAEICGLQLFFPSHFFLWLHQATLELLHFLLFLSTPSTHPPSPQHSLSWGRKKKKKKKVPPGFLALKGQKHTGFGRAPPPPPIPWALVTDREGRRQDGQGKGRKEAEGAEVWKKEKRCGEWKCCMGHFYKAALTAAHTEDGMCSSEWSKQRKWPWTKGWSGGEGGHGYHVKWWNTIQVFPGNRWEVLLKYWLFPR